MDLSNISKWIRSPFNILNTIIKFLIRNFISIILILVTVVIIFYLIKLFIYWKIKREEDAKNTQEKQGRSKTLEI